MFINSIQCLELCYTIANTNISFQNTCLSFNTNKYAIIGDNGVGKSTLLKLLAKEIKPDSGKIISNGKVVYIPQILNDNLTVAETLDVSDILAAIERINQGSIAIDDFNLAENNWDLEAKLQYQLKKIIGSNINLKRKINSFSGGEKTKILLAKIMLSKANILLLDEPTNNLDQNTKQKLINWLDKTDKCIIIASHDRALLNNVDRIIEIANNKFSYYGGNYSFYESQKLQEQNSLKHKIAVAETTIKQVKANIQQTKEKHDQKASRGKKLRKSNSIDKLTANSKKGRSEKTNLRNNILAIKMQTDAIKQLNEAKKDLVIEDPLAIDLPDSYIPNSKTLINIENLNFAYSENKLIINSFNMHIKANQRIALIGNNGTGKTTVLKLIKKELRPLSGKININIDNIGYLDQNSSNLDGKLSLLENLLQLNPTLTEQQGHSILARYKFRRETVNKKVSQLSGGEKIRASLAINLTSKNTPELLLLDEPTNHLDIKSIKLLEQALNCYKGAIIVISHDPIFLDSINITKKIYL